MPICMVTYADMRCQWFKDVNPNQKVPAVIVPVGSQKETLFESNVIFEYLVDTYNIFDSDIIGKYLAHSAPTFQHRSLSAIDRAKVNLMARVHDLYIASPNCNQPGCTHSQGGLYLPPPGEFDNTGGRRAVDAKTRSLKLAELWTRWTWLEEFSTEVSPHGPYLAGNFLSIADMGFFPTAVFMEFLLKHVADWPTLFADVQNGETQDFTADSSYGDWVSSEPWNPGPIAREMVSRFPRLTKWYPFLLENSVFRKVRAEIMGFWLNERHLDSLSQQPNGRIPRFPPIKAAIAAEPSLSWKPLEKDGSLQWPSS